MTDPQTPLFEPPAAAPPRPVPTPPPGRKSAPPARKAAPAKKTAAPPKRRPPMPPEDPDKAPRGWVYRDGVWRPRKEAGRPRKADKPRVVGGAPPVPAASKPKPARDYTQTIDGLAELLWLGLGIAPLPDQLLGYKLAPVRTRLRVQAHVLDSQRPALAAGLNQVAQRSDWLQARLDAVDAGKGGLWVIPAVLALAPFVVQSMAVWSQPLDDNAEAIAAATEDRIMAFVSELAANMGATIPPPPPPAPEPPPPAPQFDDFDDGL